MQPRDQNNRSEYMYIQISAFDSELYPCPTLYRFLYSNQMGPSGSSSVTYVLSYLQFSRLAGVSIIYMFTLHRAQPEVRRYFTADDIPAPVSSACDADVTAEVKKQTDATRALDAVCPPELRHYLSKHCED